MADRGGKYAQAIRLLVASGALASAVLCVALLRAEYPAALLGRAAAPARIETLIAADPRPALSLRGQRAQLEACDTALRGAFAALQSEDRRLVLADRCEALAKAVLARAPTLGLAHLIGAETALARQDLEGFAARLGRARAAAPAEGWQALRRSDLALSQLSGLAPAALSALRADLALLLPEPRYRQQIAARYVQQPEARPVIVAVAEALPDSVQRAFLADLRAAGGGVP